ncbi:MAG TPA: glycosyltransferase [Pyrinomonadaceae bacterium]|nr:glycosyltransferase [Pyrinomonadaceae bacterium]
MKSSSVESGRLPENGVSVVVCCHDSARLLPETLARLAAQEVAPGTPWEVIVVDNASADGTARVARECWPADAPAPLRVVHEPQLGLSYARWRGFAETRYEFVCFVDDDNWVGPGWVQLTAELMAARPEVGACGGFIEAACEAPPPRWFERYKGAYAPGAQGPAEGGDVTARRFLMGAGLTVRKSAWRRLVDEGFHFRLVDRQGKKLTAGGDHELCFALCLAGWRLWYEPRLRLQHFLPAARLHWTLFRRQARGAGLCEAGFDPYRFAFERAEAGDDAGRGRFTESWHWRTLVAIRYLVRRPFRLLLSPLFAFEGDYHIIWVERQLGRFRGMLERRRTYDRDVRAVREAAWRRPPPGPRAGGGESLFVGRAVGS